MKKARIYTDDVLFLNRGNIGETAMVTEEYNNCNIGPQVTLLRANQDFIRPKFLEYILHSKHVRKIINTFTGSTIKFVSVEPMRDMIIPVPPLEVQDEIIKNLDTFSKLIETEKEELLLRQTQLDFYMEKLIENDSEQLIPVGDACEIITDYVAAGSFGDIAKNVQYINQPDYAQLVRTVDIKNRFKKADFIYVSQKAFDFLWRVNLNEECIILPNIGVNCGEVYYLSPEMLIYDNNVLGPNAILLKTKSNNTKYLSYVFKSKKFQKQLKKIISPAGQTKFNKTELKKLLIPVPKREIQDRIVSKIEKLDMLCNDVSKGLPTEIEYREKQFDFYRDKLLSFKEVQVNE